MAYNISSAGITLIKGSEGCVFHPYLDTAKPPVPTIGWGSTKYEDGSRVTMHDAPITQERANSLFTATLQSYIDGVNAFIHVPLTQGQFDALVSLTYNEGVHAIATSTLVRKLNSRDYTGAHDQFLVWTMAGGVHSDGLEKRRRREQLVFNS